MSIFYYHGLALPNGEPSKYNRAMVRVNNIIREIKDETNMKRIAKIDFHLTLTQLISKNYLLIVDISNKNWNLGIYNLIKENFVDLSIEFVDLKNINKYSLQRLFAKISSAVLRKELPSFYTELSNTIQKKWELYLNNIPNECKINTVYEANFTNGIKYDIELENAVKDADNDFIL